MTKNTRHRPGLRKPCLNVILRLQPKNLSVSHYMINEILRFNQNDP